MTRERTMTNGLTIGTLLMVHLFLASCASTMSPIARHEVSPQMRALGPDRTLSLCEFGLRGAAGSNTAWFFGIPGAIYDAAKMQKDRPYSIELRAEFIRIYEDALRGTGAFPYLPMDKLVYLQNGKPMPIDIMAKENDLHACLTARSDLLVKIGWNKKVEVATTWKITGQSGWKLKIETNAISKNGQGKFPDTADPKMKPVFLELAQENANQFLAKLAEQGMLLTSGGR